MHEHILQTIAVSTVLGAFGVLLARWLRVPALLFLMLFGLFAGPTFLNWIQPELLKDVLMPFIEVAVAIIIFEAGLALPISGLKTDSHIIRRMLIIALPATGILAMLVAKFIVGLPWATSALFGSIIVVTGPTVIGPLLRNVALTRKMDKLFRWESVWADCIGVLLSGVVLEWILSPGDSELLLPGLFVSKLIIGALAGLASGFLLGRIIMPWIARMGDPGLSGVIVLASAVGVFYVSNVIAESSGIVAAAVSGLFLARYPLMELENIKRFKEQITRLIVAFLFVFLTAQLNLRTINADWSILLLGSVLVVFAVRMISVLIALSGTSWHITERVYVGLVGPRGIISAAVVSYYTFVLVEPSLNTSTLILLTFLTIFISGGFASILGKPLARWLRVSVESRKTGIIILGYSTFTWNFAKQLKNYVSVVIVDSNPAKCQSARKHLIRSICGNGLSDELYEDLLEQGFRRALILTPNDPLNNLIAARAGIHLGIENVFLTVAALGESEKSMKHLAGRMQAFASSGIHISTVNELIESGEAWVDILDMDNLPEGVAVETLAYEVPSGGIRISRTEDKHVGKAICLVFKKEEPVTEGETVQ